jgi:hypothetical protein
MANHTPSFHAFDKSRCSSPSARGRARVRALRLGGSPRNCLRWQKEFFVRPSRLRQRSERSADGRAQDPSCASARAKDEVIAELMRNTSR